MDNPETLAALGIKEKGQNNNNTIKALSQFFFGSLRNKLKNVVHTV